MAADTVVGSYVGTGAAIELQLGFIPDHIRIWNETDGDETYEWFSGMTAGHALKTANSASTQLTKITANGISTLAGDYAKKKGLTIGSAVSENGKTFRYVATRNGDY